MPTMANMRFKLGMKALPPRNVSRELTLLAGFIPFLGFHHVLMILIAIAIILLCELCSGDPIPFAVSY